MTEMTDDEIDEVFFGRKGGGKGHGKGKGRRSTGKGKGRRRNPIGADGEVMRCGICNSDTNFRAECPSGHSSPASRRCPAMWTLGRPVI